MEHLAGNPVALADRVEDYTRAAMDMAEAVQLLEGVAADGQSLAVSQLDGLIRDTNGRLSSAQGRYDQTAGALGTYAVELAGAHAEADGAIDVGVAALARRTSAQQRARAYRKAAIELEQQGFAEQAAEKTAYADDADRHASAAEDDYQAALKTFSQAKLRMDRAAEVAIATVRIGFEDTSDGFSDHFGAFVDWLHDGWDGFTSWASSILKDLIDGVRSILAEFLQIVSAVVFVFAMLEVLALGLLLLATEPLLVLRLALDFLRGGDITADLELLMPLLLSLPAVQAFIQLRIWSDVIAPDPEVSRFAPHRGDPGISETEIAAFDTLQARDKKRFDDVGDIVDTMTQVDDAGGPFPGPDQRGVISVRSVVDANGVERWVVTLPSTQDWGIKMAGGVLPYVSDAGASNDDDTNLALFLGDPGLRTQYERAVDQALAASGVDPSDPIVFAGFSQGGIMAAHYAAYRCDDYSHIVGIITVGAPIDGFPIPDNVAVLSVQHVNDIVPQADGVYNAGSSGNDISIMGGDPAWSAFESHNSAKYADTLRHSADFDAANTVFRDFLIQDDTTSSASVQYQWSE